MLQKFFSILKLLIIVLIVVGVPLVLYFRHPDVIAQFATREGAQAFLNQYATASLFVFVALQIFQVVVTFIPGEFVQLAGGYVFGFWLGYLLSIVGIAIGTIIAFYLARGLGRKAMHVLFGEERIGKFVDKLNSKKGLAVLFVLYVIPGIPKDLLAYAAGVSEIRFKPFLILSLVGRTPALMVSLMMGSLLHKGNYQDMIILAAVGLAATILLVVKRKELTGLTDRIYRRLIA